MCIRDRSSAVTPKTEVTTKDMTSSAVSQTQAVTTGMVEEKTSSRRAPLTGDKGQTTKDTTTSVATPVGLSSNCLCVFSTVTAGNGSSLQIQRLVTVFMSWAF